MLDRYYPNAFTATGGNVWRLGWPFAFSKHFTIWTQSGDPIWAIHVQINVYIHEHFMMRDRTIVNTWRSIQNGHRFADNIFKFIFVYENCCILTNFHWNFQQESKEEKAGTGSDNSLVLNRRQTNILNNADLVYWTIYSSSGLEELTMSNCVYIICFYIRCHIYMAYGIRIQKSVRLRGRKNGMFLLYFVQIVFAYALKMSHTCSSMHITIPLPLFNDCI